MDLNKRSSIKWVIQQMDESYQGCKLTAQEIPIQLSQMKKPDKIRENQRFTR
jgi:hypothetical protein